MKPSLQTDLESLRKITYTNRDFSSVVAALNKFLLEAFPEATGADFGEGSGVRALIEAVAYVSDVDNFYLDKTFNETILDRAVEIKNIYGLAKGLGYSPKPIQPSIAQVNFQFDVPATNSSTAQYHFTIPKLTQFKTGPQTGVVFENIESLIFNNETASKFSSVVTTGKLNTPVTRFTLTGVSVISGTTQTFKASVGTPQPFKRIHIPLSSSNAPINDVIDVIDSNGFQWYQVKNLSQEFIFTGIPNSTLSDSASVPFMLTVKRVPRRYVVEYNFDGSVEIVFGSGDADINSTEFILNPENFVVPNKTMGKFLNFNPESISLTDFLNTTTLGIAPENVTMFVTYRTGGGIAHNIGANTITKINNVNVQFYSNALTQVEREYVIGSLTVWNDEPTQGGEEAESIEQIKINAPYWYAAQDRVVSISDYIARVATLPSQYGSVYKVIAQHAKNDTFDLLDRLSAKVDVLLTQRANGVNDQILKNDIANLNASIKNNPSDIILSVICRDSNGHLSKPTNSLRQNVLTYLNMFKIASDTITVDDGIKILNLGMRCTVHCDTSKFNPSEIQLNVINLLTAYFNLSNMEVGKSINVQDVLVALKNQINGIITMPTLDFFLISGSIDGRTYSVDYAGNSIDDFFSYNGTIINVPVNAIPEVKFSNYDILVRVID